ncbi:MAG: T9SS type A sorting domain-containing protein [Bacteroidota bacterium]
MLLLFFLPFVALAQDSAALIQHGHGPTRFAAIHAPSADPHEEHLLEELTIHRLLNAGDSLVYREAYVFDEFGQEVIRSVLRAPFGAEVYQDETITRRYPSRVDRYHTQTTSTGPLITQYATLDLDSLIIATKKMRMDGPTPVTIDSTVYRRTFEGGVYQRIETTFTRSRDGLSMAPSFSDTTRYALDGPELFQQAIYVRRDDAWVPYLHTIVLRDGVEVVGTMHQQGRPATRWREPAEAWAHVPPHLQPEGPLYSAAIPHRWGVGSLTYLIVSEPDLWDRREFSPSPVDASWTLSSRTTVFRDAFNRPARVLYEHLVDGVWQPSKEVSYHYGPYGVASYQQRTANGGGPWQTAHEQTYAYNPNGTLAQVEEWRSSDDISATPRAYRISFTWAPAPTSSATQTDTPYEARLGQNYPNPFSSETTISVGLSAPDRVALTVYNLLGQRVATLHDGLLAVGEHTFDFQGDGLPNGVYVYRLSTSAGSSTRQMVLLE